MQVTFVFLLFGLARAFDSSLWARHHHPLRRAPLPADVRPPTTVLAMSSLSLPTTLPSSVPISHTPFPFPFPSSSPPSADPTSALSQSSTPPPEPDPSTTSTPSPTSSLSSSVALLSSTTTSLTPSSSAVTYTSSALAAPDAQPSSTFTPTTLVTGTGIATPGSPSSVSTPATVSPSPTATQSSALGFFSNTGAVAGTFTVVGLVSVASVITVILLIARRRHSRSYEDDTDYLDKTPVLSTHPPMTQVTSRDDGSSSDHAHYGAPMALATPPTAYYPDHAYALHPQAFSAQGYPPPGSHGYPSSYPIGYIQDYPPQHIYAPEDYNIAYPPLAPRVDPNMPNPHEFAHVELDSTPVPTNQSALPDALRPSVNSTLSVPKQQANHRFSVDSFYTGIATDTPPSPGRAL